MVAYGVFEPGKSAVMHKRGLKRDIAYWRCAKFITIGRVSGDLFESKVFVGSGAIKNHIAEFLAHFRGDLRDPKNMLLDRKSTRLNSSHLGISYAVFCLKTNIR